MWVAISRISAFVLFFFFSQPPPSHGIIHGLFFTTSYTNYYLHPIRSARITRTRLYSDSSQGNLLIFGSGNVANQVLNSLTFNATGSFPNRRRKLFCTYRNELPCHTLSGVQYVPFNDASNVVSSCSHVLITIPPVLLDSDKSSYLDPILDNPSIMCQLPEDAWIGYVSTTGVYGNHDGAWVNESSETLCKPGTKAFAYLDIEQRWQRLHRLFPRRKLFIFRCAGLYGNNMSAMHTILRQGMIESSRNNDNQMPPIESITSRVHLMDVGRAILATIEKTELEGGIYNLADSYPASRTEVMQYAKELLLRSNITVPVAQNNETHSKTERYRRRSSEKKIVANQKMLALLNDYGGLEFPSYREGFRQILQNNLATWGTRI